MLMKKDWRDFKSLHGNIEGARDGFEDACQTLFTEVYSDKYVAKMAVRQGDGGIDICVGELSVEPITVIQCKFFLETFGDAQKSQIRESFERAISSDKYELKEWILCIPKEIDIDETSWWAKWKKKKVEENSKDDNFIKLKNGINLIDLMKKHNIYENIFQLKDSLLIQEIHSSIVPKKIEFPKCENPNQMLFSNYTEKNEPYYLERDEDISFNEILKINNIWIFGQSGRGKTTLINRNLIKNDIDYLFCDLSPVNITSPNNILEEIIGSIEEKFDIKRCLNESNKIKLIVKLLKKLNSSDIVIVIDEMSVIDIELLQLISTSFISLVTYYGNSCEENNLKFVISTIAEPKYIILNNSKASEYFQYICCDNWEQHLKNLCYTLNDALNLNIVKTNLDLIIDKSQQSPRILKNIFRKIISEKKLTDDLITNIIDKTIKESF
jgi:hypothetical protein